MAQKIRGEEVVPGSQWEVIRKDALKAEVLGTKGTDLVSLSSFSSSGGHKVGSEWKQVISDDTAAQFRVVWKVHIGRSKAQRG